MEIFKFIGAVVAVHVFALVLIFANPGCSSTTKPAPADTAAKPSEAPPTIIPPTGAAPAASPAPITFNPDALAVGPRFSPTRPHTPAATTLQAEPVTDVTPATTYTVGNGDSLWSVAKKNHTTITDLANANNLKTGAVLRPGQKLIIPGKAVSKSAPAGHAADRPVAKMSEPAASVVPAKTPVAEGTTHTVLANESLGLIARKYGVKTGDIAVVNNLTGPQIIRPGMKLIIPAPGKAVKSAKPASTAPKPDMAAKPVAEPKPLFPTPANDADIGPKPAPMNEVPTIRIDDGPAPKSP